MLLLDLLYPSRCVFCRRATSPGRPSVCPACQEKTPRPPASGKKGNYYSRCLSALYYEGQAQAAIQRYKFGGVRAYASAFGELTAACIYEDLDTEYDILSWVPLASDRRRRRGYDQAELIAKDAARRLCREAVPTLRKRRGVGPQSGTASAGQRRANIVGAYQVIDPAMVEDKRILLIDDIVTTGSTLSECAKTLLLAGAEEVMCVTLACTR